MRQMPHPNIACTVLILALAGCDAPVPAPDGAPASQLDQAAITAFSTTSTPITPALGSDPFDSQRVLNRVIVHKSAGDLCTTGVPTNWTGSELFPGTSKPALKRFCVYTWSNSMRDPVAGDLPSGHASSVVHDRLAVVGLSTPAAPLSDLEDNTVDLVDPVPRYASGLPSKKTRLVLLDTVPTSDDPLSQSAFDSHGSRLAALADRFVCDSRSTRRCAATVETQLALGWEQYGTHSAPEWQAPSDGGTVGRVSDVATAIVHAVNTWHTDRSSDGTVGNLVINLSLGWHPEAYTGSSPTAAEQAVRTALEYASCHDALVVVAAGHDDTPLGDDGRTGASLPGAWETYSEPTNAQCTSKFGSVSRASRTTTYRPLVHAVSAVTAELDKSGIVRPLSIPRLVAPGEYLTVTTPTGTDPNDPISGTSAATVVASSAASVAWALSASDSPHDIMQLVYANGVEPDPSNTRRAKVYLGSTAPKVRVANVCAAAAASCAGACGAVLTDPCPTAGGVTPVSSSPASSSSYEHIIDTTATVYSNACASGSGHEFHRNLGGAYNSPDHNCPIQQNSSASSIGAVLPMPDNDICDYCGTHFTADPPMIDLLLRDVYTFGEFDSMTVAVHFDGHGEPDFYPLASLIGDYTSDHTAHLFLPEGAAEREVAPGVMAQATAVTLAYDHQGFSFAEPVYMQ